MRDSFIASATGSLALTAGSGQALAQNTTDTPSATKPKDKIPTGKIGDLQVSRMLLGGNLLTHYTHSRDLKYVYNLAAHYNTEEKILETLALAESHGVNTLSVHTVPWVIEALKKHRNKHNGKMQWIICPTAPVQDDMTAYETQVRKLIDDGVDAIYLWGVHADRLAANNRSDLIARAVEMVKDYGLPSGVGGHDLKVVKMCEEKNIAADFYIKTFHHHDYPSGPKPEELTKPYNEIPGYWCQNPQEVSDYMKQVKKPWIAFKVMAAGAIPPANAFKYSFENGADFVLAGMFDFEIAEDASIINKVLAGKLARQRPWFA